MTHARNLEWYSEGKLGYGPGKDTDSLISQPPPIFAEIIDMKTYCEVLSPITLKVESYKILFCHRNFLSQIHRPGLIILIDEFERIRKGFIRITEINHRKTAAQASCFSRGL